MAMLPVAGYQEDEGDEWQGNHSGQSLVVSTSFLFWSISHTL
jgi:hypothetical protein